MFDALLFHRMAGRLRSIRIPIVTRILARFLEGACLVLFSCSLPAEARIGSGTILGYRGLGIVIHKRAVIGRGCLIGPHVVIGGRSGHYEVPVLGDRVFVGAGAKVQGPVHVGDGAVVGANAVVVHDVPARSVVAGVPARVIATDVDVDCYATMPAVSDGA